MIGHFAFFETLGGLDDKTPEWTSVFAGLSVMRLLDVAIGSESAASDWSDLHTTRTVAENIGSGDPARAILLRILDRLSNWAGLSAELGSDLMSYGRALDLEARWTLAADVFRWIADKFPERDFSRPVIEASIALGSAARSAGDWETSARAYARAEHLAATVGDRGLALTAQIGMAGSHMSRGNLPAAESELEQVLGEAQRAGLENVQALALHARASVAHSRADYQQAAHFAYRSLELTTNRAARERILADIAAAYAGLGMRATAHDGYSIVAITSPHQWVRWQATLNLMELSIDEGDRPGFDGYMNQLESSALDVRLRAYFLLLAANGMRRFETGDALAAFTAAREFAEAHHLNQIAFQVDEAMNRRVPISRADEHAGQRTESSSELTRIAEVLGHLRNSLPAEPASL